MGLEIEAFGGRRSHSVIVATAEPYVPTALQDWDADFERQTGKRVVVELDGPCREVLGSCVYALGTDGCLRCGQPPSWPTHLLADGPRHRTNPSKHLPGEAPFPSNVSIRL